jgi:small-conductance mechanosensitive channel
MTDVAAPHGAWRWLLLPLVLLVLALSGAASAADQDDATGAGLQTAAVRLDGRDLFRMRGVTALPAEARARHIADRIAAAAADPAVDPDTIRVVHRENHDDIVVGDRLLASVLDADAEVEQVDRWVLAEANVRRIREAIVTWREERTTASIATGVGYAVLAAIGAAIAGFAAIRLQTWTLAFVDRRMHARVKQFEEGSFRLVRAEHVWKFLSAATNALHVLTLLLIGYLFLATVLDQFPWTRAFGQWLFDLILSPLAGVLHGILGHLPDLIVLAVIVFVTRYLLRWVRTFFDLLGRGVISLKDFDPDWAGPTHRLVRLVVVIFAIVVAYPYIPGSQSAAFQGISIFLGVLLSIGSSSVISNMIAGYTMTYRRAFRVGDRIKVGDTIGDVIEMRLMVTYLRTMKNEMVTIPNSVILGSEVLNYTALAKERGLILHTQVGIGYETPWRQVEAMLLTAADRTAELLKTPPPFVHHRALGDFAITYELNAYCADPSRMVALYTELHRNILDVFNEYGVQIMTPAYEGDPEQPKVVTKDQWYLPPAEPPAGVPPTPGRETTDEAKRRRAAAGGSPLASKTST